MIPKGAKSVKEMYPTGKSGLVLMTAGAHMPKGCLNLSVGQAIMVGIHATRTMIQVKLRNKAHFFFVKMDGYLKKGRMSKQEQKEESLGMILSLGLDGVDEGQIKTK